MEHERIEIENQILDKLAGKIFLLQDVTRKRDIIFQAALEVFNSFPSYALAHKSKELDKDVFLQEFFSYGIIEEFLADPDVEDIFISYLSPIYVRKTKIGLLKTDKRFLSREELDLFIKRLIIFSGKKGLEKINNVELADIKGRANIVYSPFGPQITIGKTKEKPLSIIELVKTGTLTPALAAQFWLYVEGLGVKPANILIAGGPGAGKTTLLNALLSFLPRQDRLVLIEDTLELNTDLLEYCSRLESDAETTLADLVKNSLRMRPDRVIVGEVRGKEAQDLMTVMNIGKYCMGTLHASTARESVLRLENEPMNVPSVLMNLVDVFVIMRRYTEGGQPKRVVGELVETAGMEKETVLLSPVCNYDFSKCQFHPTQGGVYRDRLSQISGKTPKDIIDELTVRAKFIEVLAERNVVEIAQVTVFFHQYINDPVSACAQLGFKREELLQEKKAATDRPNR